MAAGVPGYNPVRRRQEAQDTTLLGGSRRSRIQPCQEATGGLGFNTVRRQQEVQDTDTYNPFRRLQEVQ
jgi:hypothetical protein